MKKLVIRNIGHHKEWKHITIPSTTVEEKESVQQVLFDELMEHIMMLQGNISTTHSVVVYKANEESGLGNVIVGLVSSLFVALATDRGLQSSFHFNDIMISASI